MNARSLLLSFSVGLLAGCATASPDPFAAASVAAFDDAGAYSSEPFGDDGTGSGDAAGSLSTGASPGYPGNPASTGDGGSTGEGVTSDDAGNGDDALGEEPQAQDGGLASDDTPDGACTTPASVGDVMIVEMMIESVAGAGDYGEWIEIQNARNCALDLRGLHGECPSAAKVRTFDVMTDLWIPPGGTFVVADAITPALNHDLPGPIEVWAGQPGDVLRNEGATISLRMGDTLVDSVTYPALKPIVGASVAFPADCAIARRTDWTAWQTSTASWFPGFLGTPNAPNVDVHCP